MAFSSVSFRDYLMGCLAGNLPFTAMLCYLGTLIGKYSGLQSYTQDHPILMALSYIFGVTVLTTVSAGVYVYTCHALELEIKKEAKGAGNSGTAAMPSSKNVGEVW